VPRTREDLEAGQWLPRSPDGDLGAPLPHDADQVTPAPTNVYAATKLTQEHILSTWCRAFHADLAVLRLQNVYGPGQAVHNSYTGVLTYFARQALAGETINVYEEGGIIRDFVHVRDVVEAIMLALAAPSGLTCTLDIGSGVPLTLLDVAREVARAAQAPAPRTSQDFRMGDVRAAWAEVGPAGKLLGYQPQVSFSEGVETVLDWVGRST
jgi:dTDP-L-rhamnose 4-epimerase